MCRGVQPRLRVSDNAAIVTPAGLNSDGVDQNLARLVKERADFGEEVAARVRKWYQLLQVCVCVCVLCAVAVPREIASMP